VKDQHEALSLGFIRFELPIFVFSLELLLKHFVVCFYSVSDAQLFILARVVAFVYLVAYLH